MSIIRRIASLHQEQYNIVDNDNKVGINCLTYWYKGVWCNLYNKFTQSVEIGAVTQSIGNHIAIWIYHDDEPDDTKSTTTRRY